MKIPKNKHLCHLWHRVSSKCAQANGSGVFRGNMTEVGSGERGEWEEECLRIVVSYPKQRESPRRPLQKIFFSWVDLCVWVRSKGEAECVKGCDFFFGGGSSIRRTLEIVRHTLGVPFTLIPTDYCQNKGILVTWKYTFQYMKYSICPKYQKPFLLSVLIYFEKTVFKKNVCQGLE